MDCFFSSYQVTEFFQEKASILKESAKTSTATVNWYDKNKSRP